MLDNYKKEVILLCGIGCRVPEWIRGVVDGKQGIRQSCKWEANVMHYSSNSVTSQKQLSSRWLIREQWGSEEFCDDTNRTIQKIDLIPTPIPLWPTLSRWGLCSRKPRMSTMQAAIEQKNCSIHCWKNCSKGKGDGAPMIMGRSSNPTSWVKLWKHKFCK